MLLDRRRELRSDRASGHDRRINTNDATLKNIEDKERKDDHIPGPRKWYAYVYST